MSEQFNIDTVENAAAIVAGSQEKHVQHHWIHDALHFRSQADPALTGLMALDDPECRVQDTGSNDVCA